ncbi:MAG TPA: hypothetical protein PLO28_03115 [bacterium]|jgi:hypothetical protein|nr:hypothetical protein [bacterium]HOZ20746.1 hypothetical protein [bacterium]
MKKIVLAVLLCSAVLAFGQNGTTLRYTYEMGKAYNYAVTSNTQITQEMGGREIVTEMGQEAQFTIQPQSRSENGDYTCWISFADLKVKIKNFQMDSTMVITGLLNKRAEIVQTAAGKVLSTTMIDSVEQMDMLMQQLGVEPGVLFKRLLVKLPQEPVEIGASWSESETDTLLQGGITITVTPNTTYTFLGMEERAGLNCHKIAFKGTMVIGGRGSQMGAEIVLEGEGNVEGLIYFDHSRGVLVFVESSTDQNTTIAITGPANMTIPQVTIVKSSLSLLP